VAVDLTSKTVLKALEPNPNTPYWMKLEKGRHIGFRKVGAVGEIVGTWLARRRIEDAQGIGSASYEQKPLGSATRTFDWDAAKRAAETWFKGRDSGIADESPTVETICKEYVEDRRTEKGDKTAYDAEIRFRRTVYKKPIGAIRIDKLTTGNLKDWRAAIPGTKAAQDREFRTLKAALNLAVINRRVSAERVIEWKAVPPHKGVDGRRELFLDLKQRRALIRAARGTTKHTIEAAALTGARPGELVGLKRTDVDLKLGTATFTGKTGSRTVPLSPAAQKFFRKLCSGKAPETVLLPWNHSVEWSREIRAAAKRAKLPDGVVLYTMRHSFITEALRGGMSTLDVARLTGTSLAMIQSHYGHLVVDSARERLAAVVML
jgi:integrase